MGEINVKKLGFGLMRLPLTDPNDQSKVDMEKTREMVDRFIAGGFTYFDTAYVYHDGVSESVFGELVASRHSHDEYTITTKMPIFLAKKPEDYPRFFQEQLDRCKVDYFDYYLLHNVNKENYERVQSMGAFDFIVQKKAEGRIRHIGFSCHTDPETLDRVLTEHPEIEVVQIQLNYIDWDSEGIQSGKNYEVCAKHGVKVIVMEPLKGGSLTKLPEAAEKIFRDADPNVSLASWGIRFAASPESIMMVLSGMGDMQQLEDNMGFMSDFRPLSAEENDTVRKTVQIIRDSIAIPCTACHYCTAGCPMNIAIPEYFSLYNDAKQFGMQGGPINSFSERASVSGKPSECIECRQCEGSCPQHLPIVDDLKLVAEMFEGD